jgi:hypothetical protein
LLRPRAAPRSISDRLLGRHPVSGPRETPIGPDRALLEIPCEPLRAIADDFRGFVAKAFDRPWPATTNVRDYLALDVVTTYLRAMRSSNEAPDWYIQVTFSGCAGMAETSAEVAAHWAEIWYRQAAPELGVKHFGPFGFAPARAEPNDPAARFVPLDRLGYALFREGDEAIPANPEPGNFELDWSVLE